MNISAGKFFVLGFDGYEVPDSLKKIAGEHGLAGIILFDRNIESAEQVAELSRQLQELSADHPLVISIDQEGGRFQRLKPPIFGDYPRACDVNRTDAYGVGQRMGKELASLGITIDYAPVLDVCTNSENPIIGERAFSSDPAEVIAIASEFVKGMQEQGVLACGKHYPGHGDTHEDSHLTLPAVNHSMQRLQEVELLPFRELLGTAIRIVMTAHILYPALDPDHPATFSSKILNDLLRQQQGYQDLIITDDLGMEGALSQADLPGVCVQAFSAGCDLLMVCDHHEKHVEIIETFSQSIRQSEMLQKRALESSERLCSVLSN